MTQLFAVVHKDGLILKIVQNAEKTDDGILLTEMPNLNPEQHNFPGMKDNAISLIAGSNADLVSIVKFDYDADKRTVVNYYTGKKKTKINFAFDDNTMWRLNNNGLSWFNGTINIL